MKTYQTYLLDLDGTLYRGKEVIPGAREFVRWLKDSGFDYLYFTNNSSRPPGQVAEKLRTFGFPAEPEQVMTSSMATARFLQEETKGTVHSVYAIGEEGLLTALREAGFRFDEERPDAVVVGIDRDFHYDKMKKACLAIRNGARFIGTNGDKALPTEEGLLPGNGSLCAAIAAATGVDPVFVGKPEPFMVHYALERLGSKPGETLVVGDNLMTDIRAGAVGGIDTLLVYTGVTTREQAAASDIRPTYEVDNLLQWMQKEAASR